MRRSASSTRLGRELGAIDEPNAGELAHHRLGERAVELRLEMRARPASRATPALVAPGGYAVTPPSNTARSSSTATSRDEPRDAAPSSRARRRRRSTRAATQHEDSRRARAARVIVRTPLAPLTAESVETVAPARHARASPTTSAPARAIVGACGARAIFQPLQRAGSAVDHMKPALRRSTMNSVTVVLDVLAERHQAGGDLAQRGDGRLVVAIDARQWHRETAAEHALQRARPARSGWEPCRGSLRR